MVVHEISPRDGPDKAVCHSVDPPSDVHEPFNPCGILPREFVLAKVLPRASAVGIVKIEFYIKDNQACLVGPVGCLKGDNRAQVPEGVTDPTADPSRTRVRLLLDFVNGNVDLRFSPTCAANREGLLPPDFIECHRPLELDSLGGSNHLGVLVTGNHVSLDLKALQSAVSTGSLCEIVDHFDVTPSNAVADYTLTGYGSDFPSMLIAHTGQVDIAAEGTNPLLLCPNSSTSNRQFAHFARIPAPNTGGATMGTIVNIDGVSLRAANGLFPGIGARTDDFAAAHVPTDNTSQFDQVGLGRFAISELGTASCADTPKECVSSYVLFFPRPITLASARALVQSQLPRDTTVTSEKTDYYVNANYPARYCVFFRSPKLANRLPDGSGSVSLETNKDDLYFKFGMLPFDPNAVTFAALGTGNGSC